LLHGNATEEELMHLRNTIVIDATPERVWEVLGNLAATDEWLPGVLTAEVQGTRRVCTMADGFEIHEEISDYRPEDRTFSYRQLQVPLPVSESGGSFAVQPHANGSSTVVLESSFTAVEAGHEQQVGQMIEGAFQQALESLKRRVEAGTRWNAE
jgi:uncharacterized protein YndB with AHSA1/START domain